MFRFELEQIWWLLTHNCPWRNVLRYALTGYTGVYGVRGHGKGCYTVGTRYSGKIARLNGGKKGALRMNYPSVLRRECV